MEERERREERKGEGNSTKTNTNENIKKFREKVLNTTALKTYETDREEKIIKKKHCKTWNMERDDERS